MNKKIFKKILLAIVPVILVMTVISVTPALATDPASPPNCNANYFNVNIARSTALASAGQTVTFTLSAGNPTGIPDIGCSITGMTLTLTLPNGSTHVFGSNNYPYPTAVSFVGSADYVAKTADLVGNSWTATVSWSGTLKDGFDSPSSGDKQTSVTYIQPLQVTKTAVPAIQQTYTWTIDKSVTPAAWTLFNGDIGTSEYTISVVKSSPVTVDTVSGTISIHNPNLIDATISDVSDAITGIGTVSVSCPVSFPYTLTAGADLSCTYSSNLPDATTRTNTATVTTTGDVGGGSGTANIDFSEVTPTVIGGSINVDDTYNGGTWAFSDSGSVKYSRTFDCSGLEYIDNHASYSHTNTATIREDTAQHDDATVNVDCYKPSVTKTAVTTYDRLYTWNIVKHASTSSLSLDLGKTSSVDYTITVTKSAGTNSNWAVSGTITVHNPASIAATINSVSDIISPSVTGTVTCTGTTFPYTLAAGADLSCAYSSALPDGSTQTNTATAIQQNYNYDKTGTPTNGGTKDYSGTASVTFGTPTSVKDNCIDVSDTLGGTLGMTCASKVFTYSKTVGPFAVCGPQTSISNTASFITSDTQTTGSSSWTVNVNVNCPHDLAVFTIKKAALICDQAASPGTGSTPVFNGYEYGCIDVFDPNSGVSGYNITDYRMNQYLFQGEQLAELVVARDLNGGAGALASTASMIVDGHQVTTCSDITSLYSANLTSTNEYAMWYGHNVQSLFDQLPLKMGVADSAGFNPAYDKIYECIWTVGSKTSALIPSSVTVQVSALDVSGNPTIVMTNAEKWYLNPSISIDITFSDGSEGIVFPPAQAGQTVQSANNMIITNIADSGVDLAVFLAGNNLYDTSGVGKCPTTNVLSISQMSYRCEVGTYMSETFTRLQLLNTKAECYSLIGQHCLVDKNSSGLYSPNTLIPDASAGTQGGLLATDVLHNGASAQCSFLLTVPFPCIGTYTANNALDILVRAI